ncbi:MAG: hypothetical protein DWQ44_08920 [Bacteroidetes bacterium]|nr:MAG: hypothetical protein DWQ33_02855 [Bacteroidota bacterium]REK06411.1 MAG: hypothetical protein DWQ39_02710 [Bacteroidota bacterium]REK33177.1 MAG: hypothetical protein DWQ44_08920 [Bacteroidota bacterium]REK47013.1 MAG: hypothetical protein DWQ48_13250 [Bacteroidota bacterium]
MFIFGIWYAAGFEYNHTVLTIPDKIQPKHVDLESAGPLYRIHIFLQNNIGVYWSRPLISCPPCMASVYSAPFVIIFIGISWHLLWIYPIYATMLCGLNYIILKLIDA